MKTGHEIRFNPQRRLLADPQEMEGTVSVNDETTEKDHGLESESCDPEKC